MTEPNPASTSLTPVPDPDPCPSPPSAGPLVIRYALYTLMMLGVTLGIIRAIAVRDDFEQAMFREGGEIESCQFALIAAAAVLLWLAALRGGRGKPRAFWAGLGALMAVAAVRELDSFLPRAVPGLHWTYLAALCWAGVALAAWRGGRPCRRACFDWLSSAAGGVCWAGFICVVVFAQVFGQADFWQGVMGDSYERVVKIVVEESIELFGYALILAGAIETLFQPAARIAPGPKEGPAP